MGGGLTSCCQDNTVRSLELLEDDLKQTHSEYYESVWPEEEYIQQTLKYLNGKAQFSKVMQAKVMKHKFHQKYYLGEWNAEGFPSGQGLLYQPDVLLYYGGFKGNPHGVGVLKLIREGLTYEGHIEHGKAEGNGNLTSQDQKYHYEGTWFNSTPKDGTLTIKLGAEENSSNIIQFHNYPIGRSTITYQDGRVYKGMINKKTLAPEGLGQVQFKDRSRYQGNWEDGEMHGKGKFTWNDGSFYDGDYQHGRKHGIGKFKYSSAKVYEGSWANGKQNGEGQLFDENRKLIKAGEWKDNIFVKKHDK